MSQLVPFLPDTAPFSPAQRQWLNGYFAGIYSSQPVLGMDGMAGILPGSPASAPVVNVTLLYGSQTGTAEGVARESADLLTQAGFHATAWDLDEYEVSSLPSEANVLMICSTYGDGEMPDNAQAFWDALSADDAPRLESLNFAVLALGDTNYETFCTAGKDMDQRFEALGATRLADRVDCDVDFEEPFEAWIANLKPILAAQSPSDGAAAAPSQAVPSETGAGSAKTSDAPKWGKKNPFSAGLVCNRLLSQPGSGKETRHFEISLKDSGITYEPGDALQVLPTNCPTLVGSLLELLGCDGEEEVPGADGSATSLRRALTSMYDIKQPGKPFMTAFETQYPEAFLAVSQNEALPDPDVLDCLLAVNALNMTPVECVGLLKKIQPRAYSISSSLAKHPGEVHLTVATVRYEENGRDKKGVCSCFLADRVDEAIPVQVWITPSKSFSVPASLDAPMIMVGPGTGIAPFRAFLEEREVTQASGRNWLFFGDRNQASDFLYEDEITAWQSSGLLTRLDLAFSRDQDEKIYVQDRMLEAGAELFEWLEAGAYFYVCGDAYRMAKDVDAALLKIVETHGRRSADDAAAYISALKKEKRYVRDVY